MVEDVIRSLGFLCLGSRLKRLGEQLQSDTQRILDRLELPVQASQHPLLAALDRLGPLAVGELAEALGVTQPGITRSLSRLAGLGLVEARQPRGDQRQKIVSLTERGRELVRVARREAWPDIEKAVAELCGGLSGPLLEQLAVIEDGLAETSLDRRVKKGQSEAR